MKLFYYIRVSQSQVIASKRSGDILVLSMPSQNPLITEVIDSGCDRLTKGTQRDIFGTMKEIRWDDHKNRRLQLERGVSFQEVEQVIGEGRALDIMENPDQERYVGQMVYVVEINGYAYVVPFVETETTLWLKTIIPSRKFTKRYLKGGR